LPSEHTEQVSFVNAFKSTYKDALIFAVPNGEFRAISTAKKLKAEGVTPGVPDLVVVFNERIIFIEMKRVKGGTVSAAQKEVIAKINSLGFDVIIGKGAKDAWDQLSAKLGNTK
jgi:hypothetical protein